MRLQRLQRSQARPRPHDTLRSSRRTRLRLRLRLRLRRLQRERSVLPSQRRGYEVKVRWSRECLLLRLLLV